MKTQNNILFSLLGDKRYSLQNSFGGGVRGFVAPGFVFRDFFCVDGQTCECCASVNRNQESRPGSSFSPAYALVDSVLGLRTKKVRFSRPNMSTVSRQSIHVRAVLWGGGMFRLVLFWRPAPSILCRLSAGRNGHQSQFPEAHRFSPESLQEVSFKQFLIGLESIIYTR